MRWSDTNTAQITPTIFAELYQGPPRGCTFMPGGWDDFWNIAITDSSTPQRGTMLVLLDFRAKTRTEARARAGSVIARWLRDEAAKLESAATEMAAGSATPDPRDDDLFRRTDIAAWLHKRLDEADARCESAGVLDMLRGLIDDAEGDAAIAKPPTAWVRA